MVKTTILLFYQKMYYIALNSPPTKLLAFALVVPTYITFFIGWEPLLQGLAFSLYLIPLGINLIAKRMTLPTFKFIIFWVIFLGAWIVPSLINAYGSHLESDLVRLPVLFFHTIILTALVFILYNFLRGNPEKQLCELIRTMFWVMLPMALLILLKTFYLECLEASNRPSPFGVHPTIAAEIMFIFFVCATQVRQEIIKWTGYIIAILAIFLLEGRGALISCYLMFMIFSAYPWLRKKIHTKPFWVGLVLVSVIIAAFHHEVFLILKKICMLDIRSGLGDREVMWLFGIESIKSQPLLGLGFWVNPMGYGVPEYFHNSAELNNPAWVIHNAFIRIAAENGLILILIIIYCMLGAAIKFNQRQVHFGLAIIFSVTFYLCFSTRHLTLNLMNILLYATMLAALIAHKPIKTLATKKLIRKLQ